jgi:hypothetical protein
MPRSNASVPLRPRRSRLEKLYGVPWFSSPVRVDVVWVGTRQGAYTTDDPPHATISSGDSDTGWSAAEIVFHEFSHVLVHPIQETLSRALGARGREHGQLWHVVQFYLTGTAVQEVLRARGITYEPYMYSTGLVDRAWGRYRKPVEDNWRPYVDGKTTLQQAVDGTIAALGVEKALFDVTPGSTSNLPEPVEPIEPNP